MSSPDAPPADAVPEVPEVAEEEPAPEPDALREGLVDTLRSELGDSLVGSHITPGDDVWVRVATDAWRTAGEIVRDKLTCTYFDFLSAIDWLPSPYGRDMDSEVDTRVHGKDDKELPPLEPGYAGGDTRLQVLARVFSPTKHYGITLKVDVPDDHAAIDTWIPVYAGADWHERETWEMFGIDFVGHPHLVHLYLPGEFEGFPMRKDFPLLARRVKPWPGIVDVEPMPGGDEEEGEAEGDA